METVAGGPAPAGVAHRLLEKQERLIGWQIAAARATLAVRALAAAAGLAAAVAVAALLWQAREARGVVVDAFAVPPDLAARGLTGEVLAAQVVDGLSTLQAQTQTGLNARGVSDGTDSGVTVEIPGAGISLTELQKALRLWLGHETHVKGEAYRTAAGVALRARVAGAAPMRVEGPDTDVEALAESLARAVYAQTEPARYASWVDGRDGSAAALATLRVAASRPYPRETQAAIHERIGFYENVTGDVAAALREARLALTLDPNNPRAVAQLSGYFSALGQQEASLEYRRRAIAARRDPRIVQTPLTHKANLSQILGNCIDAISYFRRALADPAGLGGNRGPQVEALLASALARCHEPTAARTLLAADPVVGADPRVASDVRARHLGRVTIATAAEDWSGVVALEDRTLTDLAYMTSDMRGRSVWFGYLALAHAQTGDMTGAEAILAGMPADCDRCVLVRAQVAALAGRTAEAEGLFGRAAAMMPSFPQPRYELGRSRAARGDFAAALAAFRTAGQKQPRWADPLKGEGDVLLRQGLAADAARRYAKAAEFAPRWGGLHLAWGKALAAQGKTAEAQVKWRAAAGMDLTPLERAEIARGPGKQAT